MSVTDRINQDLRRTSIRRRLRPVYVTLVFLVLLPAAAFSEELADDEPAEKGPPRDLQPKVVDPIVYGWVFGSRNHLTLLREKIAIINRFCELTEEQKQRLQLAGRGANKSLMDRLEEIDVQYQLVKHDTEKVKALRNEVQLLQRGLTVPGLSKDGSRFDKALDKILTLEQTAMYQPLRSVFRAGGIVEMWTRGPEKALGINLGGTEIGDEAIAYLCELPILESLSLSGTQITDQGMAHLGKLTRLHTLMLQSTRVTDAGLANLKGLASLQALAISTHVTDAGLAHLSELTGLKSLGLTGNTQVTDAGLVHLKTLTNLQGLSLYDTEVTDVGLAHIEDFTTLKQLYLGNRVTDAGLVHLTGLASLQRLSLGNRATDAGLVHLKGLTSLQQLYLHDTKVSDLGIADLKKALPKVTIMR